MKPYKGTDILINIFTPVLLGSLTYKLDKSGFVSKLIRNYLADGLWAYAFISSILIIWERTLNHAWIAVTFIVSISFEILQHFHIIPGTGDIIDVVVYCLFYILALKLNPFFKRKFNL